MGRAWRIKSLESPPPSLSQTTLTSPHPPSPALTTFITLDLGVPPQLCVVTRITESPSLFSSMQYLKPSEVTYVINMSRKDIARMKKWWSRKSYDRNRIKREIFKRWNWYNFRQTFKRRWSNFFQHRLIKTSQNLRKRFQIK